jgi:hypothetical protein
MTLGIHFNEGIADILAALDDANAMATDLALAFGADWRDVQIARYAYQSALAHAGRAFGLQKAELVILLKLRRELRLRREVRNCEQAKCDHVPPGTQA